MFEASPERDEERRAAAQAFATYLYRRIQPELEEGGSIRAKMLAKREQLKASLKSPQRGDAEIELFLQNIQASVTLFFKVPRYIRESAGLPPYSKTPRFELHLTGDKKRLAGSFWAEHLPGGSPSMNITLSLAKSPFETGRMYISDEVFSVLVHEIMHMIDFLRGAMPEMTKKVEEAPEEMTDEEIDEQMAKEERYEPPEPKKKTLPYPNDPQEFNAFFQQALHEYEKNAIVRYRIHRRFHLPETFDSFLRDMRVVSDSFKILERSLQEKWRPKMYARLYQFYEHMRAQKKPRRVGGPAF